jgi:hypothetical protein
MSSSRNSAGKNTIQSKANVKCESFYLAMHGSLFLVAVLYHGSTIKINSIKLFYPNDSIRHWGCAVLCCIMEVQFNSISFFLIDLFTTL